MKILMSGPIRPSEDAVIEVIQTLRRQFPMSTIFLSTWTSSTTSRVKNMVDYFFEIPEPRNEDINRHVTAQTYQQRDLGQPDNAPGCKYSLYKMVHGVEQVCKNAAPYVQDSDIVMRIRTDSVFLFQPEYLQTLLPHAANTYIARKGSGFDWIGITTFANLKRIWCFSSLEDYNTCVSRAWNPEDLILRRVTIPLLYLDASMVEYYILRDNGFKHYYP